MSNRPTMAMRVSDLPSIIKFCVEKLGFTMIDYLPYADIAHILDADSDLLLFAGPNAKDVTQYLDPPRFISKPGDTISFAESDLEARNAVLVSKGINNARIEDGFLGNRKLSVPGPDNYTFAFIKRVPYTPEDVLVQYEEAPQKLEMALEGLSESALDLTTTPGQWSIRKIVHHLAESESLFMMQIKTALADSGAVYIRNPYNQETWPEKLDYAGRAIEPSVMLVKAVHVHIVQLVHHLPDYSERYVMAKAIDATDEGRKNTVGGWLEAMASHIWEHCEEIREIRCIHGV
ncbi:MAG TPA: DinB family protein [Ktedonobacteraceae bacterium]